MTEEYWANYRKNRDKHDTNMLWKGVIHNDDDDNVSIDIRRCEERSH